MGMNVVHLVQTDRWNVGRKEGWIDGQMNKWTDE